MNFARSLVYTHIITSHTANSKIAPFRPFTTILFVCVCVADLKWIKQPNDSYDVGIGKNLIVNCEAQGQPSPMVRWSKLSDHTYSNTSFGIQSNNINNNLNSDIGINGQQQSLRITSATLRDSGIYECIANNGADQELRKVFKVNVQGK